MTSKMLMATALTISTLSLGGCAQNYALEGAAVGAAAGAAAAAITGEDIKTYAAVGAAAGLVAGYFKDKNKDCDGFYNDRRGRYLDDDCRGDRRYRRYF